MEQLELYEKVVLGSGDEIACDYLTTIPNGYMFISAITDNPLMLLEMFSDPEKTNRIEYGAHVLTGYTDFVSLAKEGEDHYKVAMRKPFPQ